MKNKKAQNSTEKNRREEHYAEKRVEVEEGEGKRNERKEER